MTREEAINVLSSYDVNGVWADVDGKPYNAEEQAEAFDMAIEALEGVCFDEWCDDCKEYDTEKNCCPRFNRVIRGAMKRVPHEDGTLEVKVEDATKVGRVLISDDEHRGGLYYPDEDEPQGISFENDTETKSCSKDSDLISRAEAIDALRYAQHRFTVADEAGGMGSVKWSENVIYFAAAEKVLAELPSPDRPKDGDLISRQAATSIPILPKEHRKVFRGEDDAFETGWNEALACVNMLPSADRPRGEWVEQEDDYHHYWECSECGMGVGLDDIRNFCPNCGADMRGEDE